MQDGEGATVKTQRTAKVLGWQDMFRGITQNYEKHLKSSFIFVLVILITIPLKFRGRK